MPEIFKDAASCWKTIMSDISKGKELLPIIESFAKQNISPSAIVFGTSGWRGEIGTDFTFNNLRIVTSAIVKLLKDAQKPIMEAVGIKDFDEAKKRGIIVGHDNRFLGSNFALEVIGILRKEGIKTWYAGEAATPEFSAGVKMLDAACSINLTPSHNPANYGGFKFNPSDGGPAGPEITKEIENIANEMMKERVVIAPVLPERVDKVDLTELYIKYVTERKTLDILKIKDFINKEDCLICIDNVHGATRGCIQKILGENTKIQYLRTGNDYLFGGIAPEPSESNMAGVMNVLRQSTARFRAGFILDPDGDRIRFADGNTQISMNYFGAMAFHFLHLYKGIKGIVAKSFGTSNFVNAIAARLGIPVIETRVGFKNFRQYMTPAFDPRAIVAFEESDGISAYNHTLEKDAIFGLLLALEMIAVTGKNLSDYLSELMQEYGYYYPDRSGVSVDRSLLGESLLKKLGVISEKYQKGMEIDIGGKGRKIMEIIDVDGIKLVFDDGSWLMIRPSGTEPKVRFYIEARTEDGKKAVFSAAEKITKEALSAK